MSLMDQLAGRIRTVIESVTSETRARMRYQESLFTELLTTLAGKKMLSNDECRDIIKRAKERANSKEEQHDESKGPQCSCPRCDRRPHSGLECERCGQTTLHLLEKDNTARCRVCLTAREYTPA